MSDKWFNVWFAFSAVMGVAWFAFLAWVIFQLVTWVTSK